MNVSKLMTTSVQACSIHDTLQRAAQIMWESDCGCVPVVDDDERVVGMLTDRDVCMAGYTQGKPYAEIPVSSAMAKQVFGVSENDVVDVAETLMRDKQIRRVPVLDGGVRAHERRGDSGEGPAAPLPPRSVRGRSRRRRGAPRPAPARHRAGPTDRRR